MNFPQIQMQSTFGQIEINTQSAQLQMEQPPGTLTIEQPPAQMQVESRPARLTIDQTKAWADVNIKSAPQSIEDAAQEARQDVLEGIARRTQEGEAMMKIENGGNAIAELAKQHKVLPEHEFVLGWIPSAGSVKIDVDPGSLDIQWKVNKPIINSQVNQPIIQYTPGSVEINMKQYPSLKIDVVGGNVEQSI
ncbi:MAG: DUF6470 family protein [Bacillota bacterium]|nr:DUF6470 family protein [Bacillota bacterium]